VQLLAHLVQPVGEVGLMLIAQLATVPPQESGLVASDGTQLLEATAALTPIQGTVRHTSLEPLIEPFFPLVQICRRPVPKTAVISALIKLRRRRVIRALVISPSNAGFTHLIDFAIEVGKLVAHIIVVTLCQTAAMTGAQIVLLAADRPQFIEASVRLAAIDPVFIGALLEQIRQTTFLIVQVALTGVRRRGPQQ
jgi:hypothetical protein